MDMLNNQMVYRYIHLLAIVNSSITWKSTPHQSRGTEEGKMKVKTLPEGRSFRRDNPWHISRDI